jgi:RNA polymerase sigma factor (sigma-70 family)
MEDPLQAAVPDATASQMIRLDLRSKFKRSYVMATAMDDGTVAGCQQITSLRSINTVFGRLPYAGWHPVHVTRNREAKCAGLFNSFRWKMFYFIAIRPARAHYSYVAETTKEMIPTRATLIERLKDWQDQSSWQDFFDTYWKLIFSVARKGGLTEVEAQDVVQETMVSVARHMPSFKYDPSVGSFKAWLLNLTRWRMTDQLRKRGPISSYPNSFEETSAGNYLMDKMVDPASHVLDQMWETEWEKNLLNAAVSKVKRRLDPQKYQIFDFYVNKEWPPEKVAEAFGISVDQVYLAKHRITEMIREEVKRLNREMI